MKKAGKQLSALSAALCGMLAVGGAAAHHSFSGCRTGPECLAKAAEYFEAGDVRESLSYLHAAMESNCPVISSQMDDSLYVMPEMQDEAERENCHRTIALYCATLRKTKDDWHALSCLYGRSSGELWEKHMKTPAEKILAENNMTFKEYLKKDKIDWYREVNVPMLKSMYGIDVK
jgi:hypothetical protein